jgi:hypothetical protein
LRVLEPLGCRSNIEARRTARPRRMYRRESGLPVVAVAAMVLVAGSVAFGVPSTPRTPPPEDSPVVLDVLDSVPETVLVVESVVD